MMDAYGINEVYWEVRYEDGETELFETAKEAQEVVEKSENARFYKVIRENPYWTSLSRENDAWIS
jgi:hypothetical protein